MTMNDQSKRQRLPWGLLIASLIALIILLGLGTWQVERLQWKEALIASTQERIHEPPLPLAEMEKIYREKGTVEYLPVTVSGTFMHQGERHFLATYEGKPGFNVYTPLMLEDGRFVLVNRGFVPYEKKDPQTRLDGQLDGPVTITGLARDPLSAKPGYFLPDNDVAKISSIGKIGRPWLKARIFRRWMMLCRSLLMPITSQTLAVCLLAA